MIKVTVTLATLCLIGTVIGAQDCLEKVGNTLHNHLSLMPPMHDVMNSKSNWKAINSSFIENDKVVLTPGGHGRDGIGILKNAWRFESTNWEMSIDLEATDVEDTFKGKTYANFNILFYAKEPESEDEYNQHHHCSNSISMN